MKEEKSFEIRYAHKENGGLHTGYNTAIALLDTELAVCVDSDDYLADNAIETIINFWQKNGGSDVAGIVALDGTEDGQVIGDRLPEIQRINLIDLLIGKYAIRNGDRKLIVRSSLYKEVAPQKTFPGEKNFNPHYMHLRISKKYDFLVLNEILCVVEYQHEGMSQGILRQFYNSPKSFAETRRLYLTFEDASLAFRFRQCIHYVSSSILAGDKKFLATSPAKALTFAAIPFGFALSLYVKYKAQK
jgi:glycosyltransferase involved in cell wall biosynthesis